MSLLKGSRTLLFMAASTAIGVLDLLSPDVLSDALGLGTQGRSILLIAIPLIGFGLRMITSSPVGKKL